MDIIQKLATCDLGREVYHSDGQGHLQVQVESTCGFEETPCDLLDQVEKKGLWSEFFEMARTKGDEWILHISRYVSSSTPYSTICLVELLSILSNREAQIQLLQDSPRWLWDGKNAPLTSRVIEKARQLADSTPGDSIDKEIDLSILNGVISRLEAKRNQIE